jgi:hypothetical protein
MSDEKEYFPLNTMNEILDASKSGSGSSSTTITIKDAASETAKILIPQFGADKDWLEEGKHDWRRFGHISVSDPYWMAHFLLINKFQGGDYSAKFVEQFANLNMGVEGRHKKLTVDMQKAVSGRVDTPPKPKKNRGIMDRLLGRNKDMESE